MANSGRQAHLVLDLLTAAVFGVFSVPLSVLIARGQGVALPLVVVAAVAMTVALGFARRAPVPALVIASVTAVVQLACGLPPVFADVAVLGVLFAAGADDRRAVRLAGLTAGVLGALVAAVYLALPGWPTGPGPVWRVVLPLFLAGLFCFVLAWTFGLLVWMTRRSHRERERTLAAQRETAAEQERVRIARDVHDVVAHSLTVIVAQADGARYARAGAEVALTTIGGVARDALADVRLLLAQLRHAPGSLPQPGLADLDGLIGQLRSAGLPVTAVLDPPSAMPMAVQLALYRIAQESLTNALRHGDTSRPARLELRRDNGQVRLDLRSPLRDDATEHRAGPELAEGHGLAGMAERARLVGGTLTAQRHGDEFVVSASLPLVEPSA